MSAVENFDTKMVILRYINNSDPHANSVAEFTVDEEGLSLDDVVMDSIRNQFSRLDSVRYSMDCPGGNLTLLKILKSLKQNGWNIVTSHSFHSTSKSNAMETIFYYEKFIIQNGSQQYQRQVQHHSYTNSSLNKHLPVSGVEEAKTQNNVYANKPLPSVPMKPSSTEDSSEDVSQRRISASVTSNRDKLLMKYNQHRRVSSKTSTDSTSEPSPADNMHVRNVSQLAKSYTMLTSSSSTAPACHSSTVNNSSDHAPVSTNTSSSNPAPITVPAPSPISINNTTVQPTSNEMPKLGGASAYPSLVRRISSKGFVAAPVTTVDNKPAIDASVVDTGIASASTRPISTESTTSSCSSSKPSAPVPVPTPSGPVASVTPVPVQTSARPPPVPPPLPPAAAQLPPPTAAPAPVSALVPPPATVPAPIPPTVSAPAPVPMPVSAPAPPPLSSANPLSISSETDTSSSSALAHDETSFQSSSNPLSSNSPTVRTITYT